MILKFEQRGGSWWPSLFLFFDAKTAISGKFSYSTTKLYIMRLAEIFFSGFMYAYMMRSCMRFEIFSRKTAISAKFCVIRLRLVFMRVCGHLHTAGIRRYAFA